MFQDSDTSFYLYFQGCFPFFFHLRANIISCFHNQLFLVSVPLSVERTVSYPAVIRSSLAIILCHTAITTLCWLSSPWASMCIQRRQQPRSQLPEHRRLFSLPGRQLLPLNDVASHVQEAPYNFQPCNVLNTLSTYTGIRSQIMMSMYAAESCLSTKEKWCVNHRLLKKCLQMFNSCSNVLAWYWLIFGQYFS